MTVISSLLYIHRSVHPGFLSVHPEPVERYERFQAIVACVAEVQVEKSTGVVRVKRLVAAHETAD